MKRIKGVSFGFMAPNGYYSSPEGQTQIQRICELGVDSVALIATVVQQRYTDTLMYADYRHTPSDYELAAAIDAFHKRGIRVMLKPMIECLDSVWRGRISFPENDMQIEGVVTDYWGEWFGRYADCMRHYARLANACGVEIFCAGCELKGCEPQEARWPAVIAAIRGEYGGVVTYNADQYFPDSGFEKKWYSLLDILGVSFYTGTARPRPSADEIAEDLRGRAAQIMRLERDIGVPVFFAECGARSVEGGAERPYEYRNAGRYDGDIQAAYLRGVVKAFSPYETWGGLMWWKWDEQQNRAHYHMPGGDTGFTIHGKPAADAMREWCAES